MSMAERFSTALRPHVRIKIEQLKTADIVIGIPSYYSGDAIVHVIKTVIKGLDRYYPDRKALIVVSDGGSTDDTRDLARSVDPKSYNIDSIVTIYRGPAGKGSGLRAVFEIARFLKARAVAVFDSDLVSITPEWIRNILAPVMEGYDYVAPDYNRYKLDATITNTIAYSLTRALYGQKIRQPIGGDFGLSPEVRHRHLDDHIGHRRELSDLPGKAGCEDSRREGPFRRSGTHVPPGGGHDIPADGSVSGLLDEHQKIQGRTLTGG